MSLRIPDELRFEPFEIGHLIDIKGRYELRLDARFPFSIQLFSYRSKGAPYPLNWHERLELFVPFEGAGEFQMGDTAIEFEGGDVLVVDVKKFHGLVALQGDHVRAAVITFLPELIYNLGAPECDSQYLVPFYCQLDDVAPILRRTDRFSSGIQSALRKLIACYFGAPKGFHFQAGCKAYLLEMLYILSLHFGFTEQAQSGYAEQRQMSDRLGNLHRYVEKHFADKISVADAAKLVCMSETAFMKLFKKATGMTFISYLTQIRLTEALRLVRARELSIGEIAASVGFSDQSYFDRRFKERFRQTPKECRRLASTLGHMGGR